MHDEQEVHEHPLHPPPLFFLLCILTIRNAEYEIINRITIISAISPPKGGVSTSPDDNYTEAT